MKKQISSFVVCVACIGLAVTGLANTGLAADKVNYSGKYSPQVRETASGSETDLAFEVIQNEDSIEITKAGQSWRTTNRQPLDGSEGDYTSSGGIHGKCKAQVKGKYLVLESLVVSRPSPSSPPVRIHTKERWQLSADSKTLTIESDVDFPDAPGDVSAIVGAYGSGTPEIHTN